LTKNSPDLYALTLCNVFRKKNLFLARLTGISAIRMKIIDDVRRYNFQAFANISGKFPKILNFQKIYNLVVSSCLLWCC